MFKVGKVYLLENCPQTNDDLWEESLLEFKHERFIKNDALKFTYSKPFLVLEVVQEINNLTYIKIFQENKVGILKVHFDYCSYSIGTPLCYSRKFIELANK